MTARMTDRKIGGIQPLSVDLFSKLREDILSEILKSGEKLTEQRICDMYRVSRTPVREALKRLENEGLIEMIPHRGAFVRGLSEQDMEDMFALRKIYELQAARWAIDRITKDELDNLEEIFEFMEFYTQRQDTKRMMDINSNFHQLIYSASRNRILQQVLSSYQVYIKYSSRTKAYEGNDLPAILSEHGAIFAAFKAGDADAGERAMLRHIDGSMARALRGAAASKAPKGLFRHPR
jgi:DNA-binding GntR family transcriptional regulator